MRNLETEVDMTPSVERIRMLLLARADATYAKFNARLLPTIDPQRIIGVRIPLLRKLLKDLRDSEDLPIFLDSLPHYYQEENILHGLAISTIQDYDSLLIPLQRYLPFVDNWMSCDTLSPKLFSQRPPQLRNQLLEWLTDSHIYTIRFALVMLLKHYARCDYDSEIVEAILRVPTDDYYLSMGVAWLFAEWAVFHCDRLVAMLEAARLDISTHNLTIRKACESRRIAEEDKRRLRLLRR